MSIPPDLNKSIDSGHQILSQLRNDVLGYLAKPCETPAQQGRDSALFAGISWPLRGARRYRLTAEGVPQETETRGGRPRSGICIIANQIHRAYAPFRAKVQNSSRLPRQETVLVRQEKCTDSSDLGSHFIVKMGQHKLVVHSAM